MPGVITDAEIREAMERLRPFWRVIERIIGFITRPRP